MSNSLWHCSQKKRRKKQKQQSSPNGIISQKHPWRKTCKLTQKNTFLPHSIDIFDPLLHLHPTMVFHHGGFGHPRLWKDSMAISAAVSSHLTGTKKNLLKKHTSHGGVKSCWHVYIYMGSGRFPGPMELLLQQLVRVSKTRWRWFNLNKSMLLQPLIKKLEVLVMINQRTTYCINDNNDERWMVVLIDFYLTFCKN